jgi:hypothetical protein
MHNGALRLMVRAGLAVGAGVLCGCEPSVCDTSATAGLVVTVTTGDGGPPSCTAVVTVTSADYSETLQAIGSPCRYSGAYERPGTYAVTVKQEPYAAVTKSGIVVPPGECHVETVAVTVPLLQ